MSDSLRLGLMVIVGVIVLSIVIKILVGALAFIYPFAILAGIGLVVYGLFSRRSLGGGRRYLP
ncbi:MAG: hypothetical protein HY248_00370 [Fimbriimonas ginsengisoli]|uniref:Uncharacterized protein n=1 Tax=Fimbriimonas ginsengisoli TaxID=1005039 RepID=A0A931LSK6_FIMGI|nr:hypothetical protein [Fimbriimonas ginsengisoli]MBI3720979.1 hypothetical protein [Fimbriimonas ginsengisoli]